MTFWSMNFRTVNFFILCHELLFFWGDIYLILIWPLWNISSIAKVSFLLPEQELPSCYICSIWTDFINILAFLMNAWVGGKIQSQQESHICILVLANKNVFLFPQQFPVIPSDKHHKWQTFYNLHHGKAIPFKLLPTFPCFPSRSLSLLRYCCHVAYVPSLFLIFYFPTLW